MAAAALPAPSTMVRPAGAGGRCAAITLAGLAALIAASSIRRSRVSSWIMVMTELIVPSRRHCTAVAAALPDRRADFGLSFPGHKIRLAACAGPSP